MHSTAGDVAAARPAPQFGQTGRPAVPLLVHADHEREQAVRAGQLLVEAQERRGHRAGRHDISLGGEGPEQEDADPQEDEEFDRLAANALLPFERTAGGIGDGRGERSRRPSPIAVDSSVPVAITPAPLDHSSPSSRTERKASCEISTLPTCFIRFLPSFCFSSSLRFREMSPP